MSGNLDYGFIAKVMELMELEPEQQLEIIRKINAVEEILKEKPNEQKGIRKRNKRDF